jgi:hypothetical protein
MQQCTEDELLPNVPLSTIIISNTESKFTIVFYLISKQFTFSISKIFFFIKLKTYLSNVWNSVSTLNRNIIPIINAKTETIIYIK